MVVPKYPRRAPIPGVLDAYKEVLVSWLKADSYRNKRERRGVKALFEALQALGYRGGNTTVYRFAKSWREEQNQEPRGQGSYRCSLNWGRRFSSIGVVSTWSLGA